jgi:hypothetical protein
VVAFTEDCLYQYQFTCTDSLFAKDNHMQSVDDLTKLEKFENAAQELPFVQTRGRIGGVFGGLVLSTLPE